MAAGILITISMRAPDFNWVAAFAGHDILKRELSEPLVFVTVSTGDRTRHASRPTNSLFRGSRPCRSLHRAVAPAQPALSSHQASTARNVSSSSFPLSCGVALHALMVLQRSRLTSHLRRLWYPAGAVRGRGRRLRPRRCEWRRTTAAACRPPPRTVRREDAARTPVPKGEAAGKR